MIDPVRTGAVGAARAHATQAQQPSRASEGTSAAGPSLPRLVALAQELSRQEPPVDYVRIAQLRAAIADGSYKVDANAIARAMQHVAGPHE